MKGGEGREREEDKEGRDEGKIKGGEGRKVLLFCKVRCSKDV